LVLNQGVAYGLALFMKQAFKEAGENQSTAVYASTVQRSGTYGLPWPAGLAETRGANTGSF
jgi:hypothetical protein